MRVEHSSKSPEWETPQWLYSHFDKRYKFTIDAAASDLNHKHETYWTREDDALVQDWTGHSIWLNPPYQRAKPNWQCFVRKAWESRLTARVVCMLLPARTDTLAWHEFIWKSLYNGPLRPLGACVRDEDGSEHWMRGVCSNLVDIWFLKGRLKFVGADSGAPFPSAIVVFGKEK